MRAKPLIPRKRASRKSFIMAPTSSTRFTLLVSAGDPRQASQVPETQGILLRVRPDGTSTLIQDLHAVAEKN